MRARLIQAVLFGLCLASPVLAQSGGITTPSPGGGVTVSGPNSVNPSAAASDLRSSGAVNPSAAVSGTASPNVLNPSGTPSTFAPTSVGGSRRSMQSVPAAAAATRVRRSRLSRNRAPRRAEVRTARRAVAPANGRLERRARGIVSSVCRGC